MNYNLMYVVQNVSLSCITIYDNIITSD